MGDKKVNKLLDKLKLKDFKLNSLLDVTTAINENYSTSKLLQIYEFILRDQLGITKLALFSKGSEWECLLKYNVKKASSIDVDEDLIHIKEITVIESSSKNTLNVFDVVIPVYHKEKPLAYLLIGDLNEDAIKMSPTIKHMPFIQTLTNIIMVAIENKRLANESIQQEVVKKELEVAAELQKLLFPDDLPTDFRVNVAAQYTALQLVGGDYYDYIVLNEDEVIICMADVSGKGIGAAMLMSNFQAHVKAIVNYTDLSLTNLIKKLNKRVMEAAQGEKFITFFIARYNFKTRKLNYINAGHNHPLLATRNKFELLGTGCTGLGMFDVIPSISEGEVDVPSNATLILYTDGLVEIENDSGEAFETDNVYKILHDNYNVSMNKFNNIIFDNLETFKESQPFVDDTAILSCRFY